MNNHQDILELFAEKRRNGCNFLNVSAPMVRYSKLEFRKLLRKNNVHLCFTPMIIADSFNRSEEARLNEFTTNNDDHPLIAQFAAKSAVEMLTASNLIYPYVNGVDLNCGCPQTWAIAKGYGCSLLRQPELLYDIVHTLRRNLPSTFSCSFKLRLLSENGTTQTTTTTAAAQSTVELCRQLEMCGITFLTLHGRTQWQKTSHQLDVNAIAEVKKSIKCPLIANGNVQTFNDACTLHEMTNADGIMAARGLLVNPSLFNSNTNNNDNNDHADDLKKKKSHLNCIQQWLDIAIEAGDNLSFQCFHHHLTFMWGKMMNRKSRVKFNNFTNKEQVFEFFSDVYGIQPNSQSISSAKKNKKKKMMIGTTTSNENNDDGDSDCSSNTVCNYSCRDPATASVIVSNSNHSNAMSSSWNPNGAGKFFTNLTRNHETIITTGTTATTTTSNCGDNLNLTLKGCSIFDL